MRADIFTCLALDIFTASSNFVVLSGAFQLFCPVARIARKNAVVKLLIGIQFAVRCASIAVNVNGNEEPRLSYIYTHTGQRAHKLISVFSLQQM